MSAKEPSETGGAKQPGFVCLWMHRDVSVRSRVTRARISSMPPCVSRRGVCFQGAQSMGGLMTLHAVLRNQSRLRGVVLTSALINVQYTPILRRGRLSGDMHAC